MGEHLSKGYNPAPEAGRPARRIGTRLNRRRILALIAAGHSPADAAAALGVTSRTVYRALQDPEVRTALDEFHRQRMQALLDSSMSLAPGALETLRSMMDSPIVPASTKVAAARAAMSAVAAIVPLADADRRIAALEEKLTEDPFARFRG